MDFYKTVVTESSFQYCKKHLEIISALLPVKLHSREIDVLATFFSLPRDITEGDLFNTLARKKVKSILKMSDGGLSNHIKNIYDKGFIYRDGVNGALKVKDYLIPSEKKQIYKFKLIYEKV